MIIPCPRKALFAFAALAVFCAGLVSGIAANRYNAPKTVVHVVTVKWKPDSTPAQRQAAIDGVKKMAAEIPGVTNIWLKTLKVQGEADAVLAMEFQDQAAFDAYANNPAHKEWEKVYLPVRQRSTTHDVTN